MTTAASYEWAEVLRRIPGYDPWRDADGYEFREDLAERAVEFFPKFLTHLKGPKAGEPFELAPWQQAVIANLFGWVSADGVRRYREALIYVPRKNGKTLLAAGICLLIFFTDGEPGAEIYAAAAEKEQAKLLFDLARRWVRIDRRLDQVTRCYRNALELPNLFSFFRPISAESDTKHGYNASAFVLDELHVQRDRELCDVLETSMGSRAQPLAVYITTADFDRPSICNEKHDYASRVRDGEDGFHDPRFLPVVYEAKKDDDWEDPEVWARANPGYGESVRVEYLERMARKAAAAPSFENAFRRLHLNVRTEQAERAIQMSQWDACSGELEAAELEGRPCCGGLDLSDTRDITALVLYFPEDRNAVLPFFWVPRETAEKSRRTIDFKLMERRGLLRITEGAAVDYDEVRATVRTLAERFGLQQVGYDPHNATQLAMQLTEQDGIDCVAYRQGYVSMNEPLKRLLHFLLPRQELRHGGNPVLRWMASNVATKSDSGGNLMIDKKKSYEKVDGIVALVMALGVSMSKESGSVYDDEENLWSPEDDRDA